MPSAGSVTDLVIFAGIAIFSMLAIWLFLRFTPIGKRMSQESSSHLDFTKPAPYQPKTRYSDPLSGRAVRIWYIGLGIALVLSFVYYFFVKGGFSSGN